MKKDWKIYAESCVYEFPNPLNQEYAGSDLVCIGADLEIPTLINAYSKGLFPMHISTNENSDKTEIGWFSPNERCIFDKKDLRITKSLKKSYKKYTYSINQQFEEVMRQCMNVKRPHGWLDDEFIQSYTQLHKQGYAHSFETYSNGELVGGLYGVSFAGLFAGESMFHTKADASKCALIYLTEVLEQYSIKLLDAQWQTPHLKSLGAKTITKSEYIARLNKALQQPSMTLDNVDNSL